MKKIVLAAVLSMLATAAHAQQVDTTQTPNAFIREYTSQRFAVAGKKSIFGAFYSLKADCAPVDWIQAHITKPPENGEAKIVDGNAQPNYAAPNPRVKCNDKSIRMRLLEYVPNKGYAGPDQIEAEMIDSGGSHVTYTINITVK